jgi:Ni/Co efflux regulator RcnB
MGPAPAASRGRPPGVGRMGGDPGWDQGRYNGYYVGGRWYYGAPQQPAYENPGFRPGFTPWRRGSFLPPQYQTYEVYDFDRFHLRRPPNGYHWVQVGGEFLLVSVSTGLIFDVVQGG